MYEIIDKKIVNEVVEQMIVKAPFVSKKCEPGQFIIIRVNEDGERVPLTIADYNRENGTITIVYQKVGFSTKLLGEKNIGDYIYDVAGPLGNPTHLEKSKRVLGIGGGVGSAPLYPQIKALKDMGVSVDVILGARNEKYIVMDEEFQKIVDNVYYVTDDGSKGSKGFVTDVLKELIEAGNIYDEVIAIGPVIMMKNVVNITKPLNIKTSVSLNPIMIDGTGMCGGCRVLINNKTKFACVDGPDFDGFSVDFDMLMTRQNMFKSEEHNCMIGTGE